MALNYRLKKGVLLQAFGDAAKTCTNDSPHFTDELAEWYIRNVPGVEKYFDVIPGRPSEVTPSPRPPRQAGATVIVPPQQPAKAPVIIKPVIPVIIEPEQFIAAATGDTKIAEPVKAEEPAKVEEVTVSEEPVLKKKVAVTKRKTRVASKSTK